MKWLVIVGLFANSFLQAQVYEFNSTKLGQWNSAGEAYSDVWGYSAGGKEYAILGSAQYIYFFEVTNPANIRLVERFGPYTSTPWREFKTYSHYAYAVSDGPDAGGLRIFDLASLPTLDTVIQVRQTTAFFTKCHMPFIDEAKGRLYCAGTNTRNDGIIVLDLSVSPDNPTLLINQVLPRGYVHDMYVINNVMYASHIYQGYLSQYNCAGNSCSGELSAFQTGGYNHSSWMNADQTLMINAIETAGHPLWLLPINNGAIGSENVKTFKSVTLRDQYPNLPPGETGSIGHNPYIIGDLAYVSYYTDGVQVYNISDVNNVRRVAYFDTDRGYTSYSPAFRGCWGTYPFLPSGNILASDIQSGLWVFKTTACALSQPPTISISTNSSTYARGSSFTINASVSDPDGMPSKVEFYNGNLLLGTALLAPYSYTVSPADAASYSITAKVFDNCGIITVSSVLNITTFSCDDGVQNGDETGIDCGGSCISCSQPCPAPVNLSQGKTATQSSLYNSSYPASKAVDGSTSNTNFNCTLSELQPWWQVNLEANQQVNNIEITNRTGCPGCNGRIKRFKVFVTSTPVADFSTSGAVFEYNNPTGLVDGQVINISNLSSSGQYVRIWVDNTGYGANYLHLAEVKVLNCNNTSDPCANNLPPTISLSSVSSSYPKGSSFTVNTTVNDPDGTLQKVEFYNNNILLETDYTAPFNLIVSPADAASYSITGKVFDNCNLSILSSPLSITTFSCTDGIQNGNETGVDCGGSCISCSQSCPAPVNLSQGKTATQSSLFNAAYPASKAVDGSTSNTSFNCTLSELQPWWQVNLGANNPVTDIEITNRTGCPGCNGRLKRFKVFVTASPVAGYSTSGAVFEYNNPTGLIDGQVINISNLNSSGQYVRIWVDNTGYGANYLHLAEVKVLYCNNTSDPCPNNLPPTISLSSVSSSYPKGSSFTVNATVNDPDGTPEKVEFYNNNVLLETDNSAPFNLIVSPADAASYSITGKVFDTCNLSTLSSPLSITTFSCTDGIQNGNETGVDCGGSCNACSQLCPSPVNLSQGKTATQSSLYNSAYPASKAVDGSTINTSFNCTQSELQPWWQVNLGASYSVTNIEITNRTGCPGCNGRLKRFKVFVTSSPVAGYSTGGAVYEYNNPTGLVDGQVINITNLISSGQYVRIWMDNTGYGANYLHLAEVKVMGCASSAAIVGPVPQINPSFSSKESGVKLFPNPTRDMIHFQFENQPDQGALAQIYDLQGRLLISEKLVDNKVNLSRLESGSYIIHIQWNGNRYIHKVVKI